VSEQVLHEVIAKTHHTLNMELRKVTPTVVIGVRVHKIHRLFRHMQRSMERYDLLDQRFKASSAIVQKVAKLNSKKLPGASISQLQLQLGKIKKGNNKLKLEPKAKPQTASQLASDISELLKKSEHLQAQRLQNQAQLKEHLVDAKKMKTKLAHAQSQLSKIESASSIQEAGLAKLQKYAQKTSTYKGKVSQNSDNDDSPDLGESMEDGDPSINALSSDIDSFLDDDNAAHEDDDPWLMDLIQIDEHTDQQELQSTYQQAKIPFLTDEQSAKAFNSHSDSSRDSSLFAKDHGSSLQEANGAAEAAAKAAYEAKHNIDDETDGDGVVVPQKTSTKMRQTHLEAAYDAYEAEPSKGIGEDDEPSQVQEGKDEASTYKQHDNGDDERDDDYDDSMDEPSSFIPYQIN
jgi:hypothetical protein